MKHPRRSFRHLAAAAVILAALSTIAGGRDALAQGRQPVRVIVPTPPAGVNDLMARLLSEYVGRVHGLNTVVENRPGAAESIGTESVARAAPDGNTLLFASSQLVINPHLRKYNYHPLESFEPICQLVVAPTVMSVNGTSAYRSLKELLDAARAKPGSVTMASIGPGTPFDIGLAMLKRAAGVDITFVPYNGNAPSINALLGDHVTSAFNSYSSAAEQIKAGKMRPLAVAMPSRIEPLPQVPTVAESGYPGYEVTVQFGVYAPANTPKDIAAQFARWFTEALQAPEIKTKLAAQELYPLGICGPEFSAHLRKEHEKYGRAIREANFKVE
jgi:tripartite-type tricarboxylate transporter receptor subunit TctC